MRQQKIASATDAQLRHYGEISQIEGIENARTRAGLMAVLGPTLGDRDFILVDDTDDEGDGAAAVAEAVQVHICEELGPTVLLRVMPQAGQQEMVYPCINGHKPLVIRRGELVGVPYAYYEDFMNAKTGEPYVVEQGPGQPPLIKFSNVTNYPLSDVTLPPKREIDAWRAKYGSLELGEPMKAAA